MSHTEINRRESHEKINQTVVSVLDEIRHVVLEYGPISAWRVAELTGRQVYTVRPRLTELRNAGKIKEAGSAWWAKTQRNETLWDAADKQLPLL